jgi:hypothetical protein
MEEKQMFVNNTSGVIRTLIGAAVFSASTALTGVAAMAQQVEVVYGTFLDPNNSTDPRAAAQTKMIKAFE